MLGRPTDVRPHMNDLIAKYFKFVLKSKRQPLLAQCLAIDILQNGRAGVVAKGGLWIRELAWKGTPSAKERCSTRSCENILNKNIDDSRMLW